MPHLMCFHCFNGSLIHWLNSSSHTEWQSFTSNLLLSTCTIFSLWYTLHYPVRVQAFSLRLSWHWLWTIRPSCLLICVVQSNDDILEEHITSAQLAAYFCWLNAWFTLKPWWLKQYVPHSLLITLIRNNSFKGIQIFCFTYYKKLNFKWTVDNDTTQHSHFLLTSCSGAQISDWSANFFVGRHFHNGPVSLTFIYTGDLNFHKVFKRV
jgi:hypothetical protein